MRLTTRVDPSTAGLFHDGTEHLRALLDWLSRLLEWHITVTRQLFGPLADNSFRGLYIPRAEIDILSTGASDLTPDLAIQRAALAAERTALDALALATMESGVYLPLCRLAQLFTLSPFECDVLLLALAPELDLRFERIYAYIQDDVSRRRPAVDLALRLLCATPAERLAHHACFEYTAPLLCQRLLLLFKDGQRRPPLLARFIKLDDRIVAELRGDSVVAPLDRLLGAAVSLSRPTCSLDDLVLPAGLIAQLRSTVTDGLVLALQGGYGSGRRAIAEALCANAHLPLLTVDLGRLTVGAPPLSADTADVPAEIMRRIVREATLRGAAILWSDADALLRDEGPTPQAWRPAFLEALAAQRGCSFLLIERAWEAHGALPGNRYLRLELPPLAYGDREQLWRSRLNGDNPGDATLQALASTFRLSPGQIRNAVAMARSLAHWRGPADNAVITSQDLYAACRAQSSGRLDTLAHKVKPTYTWADIVLPPDQIRQLGEICIQVRHRRTVLEQWGFDLHMAMGKGVNVLFAGQSGTGKTMAAEIIAADLGLELYKIDLSTMVSKYIGETEKNLDRVFTAAREANAILFFDEADTLFGKRSEVKDAHDRYANIEVGYLLQKMEEYDGVVILATNLRKNLDEAFVRRLHVAIDFPFPEEDDRRRIWQKVFPAAAPLADDVDRHFLAQQFKLAGGSIRNVALLAAFLAAEDGGGVAMRHLVRAIRREYQKIGKLVTTADFGPYASLVRGS